MNSGVLFLNIVIVSIIQCTASLNQERISSLRQSIKKHLQLSEIPTFTEEEYDNFVVPEHVQSKYDYLLKKHQRIRRSSGSSLANLYHTVHENAGISGDIVYTDPFRERLQFDMEGKIPPGSVVTMAELRLFKKLPNLSGELPRPPPLGSKGNRHPHSFLQRHPGRFMKPIKHARVSIYHTLTHSDGSTTNHLIDSRLIMVNGSGWQAFDVTEAIHQWQKHPTKFMSIKLEMWIEGTRPGRYAATVSKLVRFSGQSNAHISEKPELIVFTEQEEITRGRVCKQTGNKKRQKCCRGNHYIDFGALEWTQFWILEPKGYDAYSCDGRCTDSKRSKLPRSCNAAESDPLPVMFLVRENGETRVEVSEFPNMIIKRCSCALDNFFSV